MKVMRISTAWVRIWRLLALCAAAFLLHNSARKGVEKAPPPVLEDARAFFPSATLVRNTVGGEIEVVDGEGNTLGRLLTTSPGSDGIIGYSGPSNLLVALGSDGKVAGVKVLSSGDTESHVEALKKFRPFWSGFVGWKPETDVLPKVNALAGSTLTSLAMAEGMMKRLSGERVSLRFPDVVKMEEVRFFFPNAATLKEDETKKGWSQVFDEAKQLLGFVVRTSPVTDDIVGYAGPTESLVAVAPDQRSVLSIQIRKSYDTEEYVDRVREDRDYLKMLAHWKVDEWPTVDFEKEHVEGVAGATLTSYALAEGLKRRFSRDTQKKTEGSRSVLEGMQKEDWGVLVVVLGALLMSFTALRGVVWVRAGWQIFMVVWLGITTGQFLSIAQLFGWSRVGIGGANGTAMLLLASVALLVPWGARRQIYCHQICPHGIVQGWFGRFQKLHINIPGRLHRILACIPGVLLVFALTVGVLNSKFELSNIEPFDAWILREVAGVSAVVAGIGLLASLFVPQAYCRYGCPTGALFKFVRTASSQEQLGIKDAVALGALLLAACMWVLKPSHVVFEGQSARTEGTRLHELRGTGFGTTWCIKVRGANPKLDELRAKLADEVERIERTLSPWRPESVTSRFNSMSTTELMDVPEELVRLVRFTQRVSQATDGAYDITVEPLVSAWGYGPEGEKRDAPSRSELAKILERVGWGKLVVGEDGKSLRKTHPELRMILSLLQAYAVDRMSDILTTHGCGDYLIELGGELLARGSWSVAIENPFDAGKVLQKVMLKDGAMATSGLYRARKSVGGREVSHIISPKTGEPVPRTIELCSVIRPSCLEAKGWVTGLIASGMEKSREIAEREKLDAYWVKSGGGVEFTGFGNFFP